jgi:chromosome segregation ATPase
MSSKTNMEQTIQPPQGDNQELMKENASLKRQIGGFKASNYRYKKQAKNDALYVKSLQNDLAKCKKEAQEEVGRIKAYAKEADEMNEKKAEQIASLNATVEEKDRVIAGLQSQIAELNKRIANNEKNIQDLTGERDVAIANYDHICALPWYQRMFFKGK